MNSPVKRKGRDRSEPENVIYVFTRLPEGDEEMAKFFKSKKVRNSRDVFQELFGGRASKNIVNLLKGDTAEVGINIVDTNCLFAEDDEVTSKIKTHAQRAFEKAFRGIHGRITEYSSIVRGMEGDPFGDSMSHWFVPDPQPFARYARQISEKNEPNRAPSPRRTRLLKLLQRQFLPTKQPKQPRLLSVGAGSRKRKSRGSTDGGGVPPPDKKIPRRFSDDSLASHASSSRRSGGSAGATAGENSGSMGGGGGAGNSRGQRLVRLSSTTLETRKQMEAERAEADSAAVAARGAEERSSFREDLRACLEGKDADGVTEMLGHRQASSTKDCNTGKGGWGLS